MRCPWTWPTSFKAWKPSKDWSRFEPPTLFGLEFHRSTNLHQSIYPYWKKSVPNLNHYSRSYIQKTQKENHEIKIPEDRKLKKHKSFMNKWSQNFDWLMKTRLQISEWKNFALSRWNFFVRSQNSLTLVIQSKFLAKRFCIDTSVRCISQPWQVAPPSGRGFNLFAFHAHFKSVQCLQYSATELASLAPIEFLIFVSSAENFLLKFHHPSSNSAHHVSYWSAFCSGAMLS